MNEYYTWTYGHNKDFHIWEPDTTKHSKKKQNVVEPVKRLLI